MTELQRDGREVYVPSPDSPLRHTIRAGSGIVGTAQPDGRILIYYEGNVFGAPSMERYEDKLFHAYDRMVWQGRGYPTTAMALVDASEVIEIGHFDPEDRRVLIADHDALNAWLAEPKP